jgi:hypothetical protein
MTVFIRQKQGKKRSNVFFLSEKIKANSFAYLAYRQTEKFLKNPKRNYHSLEPATISFEFLRNKAVV